MRKIVIGISGPAGSGKSTAARLLREMHGFSVIPFAGPLKRMALAFGLDEAQVYGDKKESPFVAQLPRLDHAAAIAMLSTLPLNTFRFEKDPPGRPVISGIQWSAAVRSLMEWGQDYREAFTTPRRFLQLLGTEWGREQIGPNLWVDVWRQALAESTVERFGDVLAVADDCRFENEAAAIRAEGGVVICLRRPGAGSATGADHASEGGCSGDVSILNDGPVDVLAAQLHRVLEGLLAQG